MATVARLAAELGVPRRTVTCRLALTTALADAPDLAKKVDAGQMEPKRALRIRRERQAAQRVQDAPVPVLPPDVDLRLGHFRQVLADLPDESVDLIFTDSPYPTEHLPVWSDLAALAARVLKPGALLVAYSGQWESLGLMCGYGERLTS